MTKTELINEVSEKAELSKKDAGKAVDAVVEAVTKALAKGDNVQLIGFGNFESRQRQARKGRNPRTGAELRISARRVPAFRAGRSLREAVAARR